MSTTPTEQSGRVLVIGAGAWGTALACVFARGAAAVDLWDTNNELIHALNTRRRHPLFGDGVEIDAGINCLTELSAAVSYDCVLLVVPYQVLRQALASVHGQAVQTQGIACASKGFELGSVALAHEIVAATWPTTLPFAQLSGPNFAVEVARNTPAAITIGCSDTQFGQHLANMMHGPQFRPYLSDDVIGVEIGGALKNVIAIAAGIADGLGLGANTRAALVTRGLAEIARFGCARGARMETFMGLSGMGDLVLTCTDDQSRNRRFGLALAELGEVGAARDAVGALVEGVTTAQAFADLANRLDIEMPITAEVAAVLAGDHTPEQAVKSLLARDPVSESA